MSKPDREAMLERAHPEPSIRRQCTLISVSRSGVAGSPIFCIIKFDWPMAV
jgi:hypothetical protein